KCLQDEPAFCTAVCPFSLDVRDFIAKMQRGGFGAAYRAYVNAVAFPEIVSQFCDQPCKKACIRGKVDSPVSLKMLEAAAVKYAPNPRPNSYSMPPKNKKIAIIGAGLSGLACALRLASQKYEVTVYEAKNRIGGELWEISPTGDFLEEIERQFQYEDYKLCLGVKVESLSDIQCDAVYIATGKGGENFGAQLTGEGAYATNIQGVFMGGELTGRTLMESLADGLTVIHSIDRYLKTGAMNQPYVSCGTRLAMKTQLIEKVEKAHIQGEFLTKEEAVEEAKRCIRCRCDSCLRGCDMMGYFSKYPRRIEEEVEVTIHPGTLDGNGTVATRLISTCNQCGRCKVVCPQGIDVGKFLLANHKIMKSTDAMPWVYHEFWLRDMAFSCS
ncbi:MAG: FAD-dependent oxidoreductase, partial [Oscillospiraceae bacterium]